MYAVIATGGKQYRVTKDATLRVEKLDAEPGATVEFGEVLLMGEGADVKLGAPLLKGHKVVATVVRHGKGEKVSIIGPSGSGKTTVLRLIGGFEKPTEGSVELGGKYVTALAPFERSLTPVFPD